MTPTEFVVAYAGPIGSAVAAILWFERRFTRMETILERVEKAEIIHARIAEVEKDVVDLRKWRHEVASKDLQIHESRIAVLEAVEGVHDRRGPHG